MKRLILLSFFLIVHGGWAQEAGPAITVVPQKESRAYEKHRRVLIGPGFKQPKPYPGYAGFVGWASIARTRTGALLLTFSSGYWHASPPTPITGIKADDIQQWQKMGMWLLAQINIITVFLIVALGKR